MKAWKVGRLDDAYSSVVFAETRGKAREVAMDTDFIEIGAWRCKKADGEYRGHFEMDWYDPKDRLFLIKELGFTCEYFGDEDCEQCVGKDFCDIYIEHLNDEEVE